MLGSGEHYALEVRGDSMVEAGILDGDMALIQRNESADTGDIVVALIDDEEATLKRFRRRGASIALEPANAAYEVRILPPNRVKIQGKQIGIADPRLERTIVRFRWIVFLVLRRLSGPFPGGTSSARRTKQPCLAAFRFEEKSCARSF
jgi:hypothetical protein